MTGQNLTLVNEFLYCVECIGKILGVLYRGNVTAYAVK